VALIFKAGPKLGGQDSIKKLMEITPHEGPVTSLDSNREVQQVVSSGEDGKMFLYNLTKFDEPLSLGQKASLTVDTVRFASPSTVLSTHGSKIDLWDTRSPSHKPAMTLFKPERDTRNVRALPVTRNDIRRFWDVAVHPTMPHICGAGDSYGSVSLWDLRLVSPVQHTGAQVGVLPFFSETKHKDHIWKVSFVPFPYTVLTAGEDGRVLYWNFAEGRTLALIDDFNLLFNKDNRPDMRQIGETMDLPFNDFAFWENTMRVVFSTEGESLVFCDLGDALKLN